MSSAARGTKKGRASSAARPEVRDDVAQRLANLRPSRELIEYYRKKVEDLSSDHEQVMTMLEKFRMTFEDQNTRQEALRQKEEEIGELQRALSDMQVFLFQEREQVLRLYSENDRLKIRELEDRKRIQQLLQLSGVTESEVTYFVKEPPGKAIVKQHSAPVTAAAANAATAAASKAKRSVETVSGLELEAVLRECEALGNQVEALQAQLTEQTALAKEEIAGLIEDRRVRVEEAEVARDKEQGEIRDLMGRLKQTQELLYESSRDFLEQRLQYRRSEKEWMTERERLLEQVDAHSGKKDAGHPGTRAALLRSPSWREISGEARMPTEREQRFRQQVSRLEEQLGQQQELSEMYREQLVQMEDDVSRMREEGDVSKLLFRDRTERITKRLNLMNQRYADLERRRRLELEGFQTDIKTLREKMRKVERRLYKITLGLTDEALLSRPEDLDLAVLKNVHTTATQSKKLSNELRNLKAMMYGLENEFRQL